MVNHTSEHKDDERIELTFALRDLLNGEEVSPANVTAHMLNEFVPEVVTFLRGSKQTDLKKIHVQVKPGSLAVVASGPAVLLEDAKRDYEIVSTSSDISGIDRTRRRVVLAWQRHARDEEFRSYLIRLNDDTKPVAITAESDYQVEKPIWVDVEKYVYGRVYDLGGKNRANVHVELENGSTIKIESDSELLATDKENRVYQQELLRIQAKQNMQTGELSNEKLIGFERYNPHYDEDIQAEIEEAGRLAWAGINATEWVESIRGNTGGA